KCPMSASAFSRMSLVGMPNYTGMKPSSKAGRPCAWRRGRLPLEVLTSIGNNASSGFHYSRLPRPVPGATGRRAAVLADYAVRAGLGLLFFKKLFEAAQRADQPPPFRPDYR